MKNLKLIFILLLAVTFSSCEKLGLKNNFFDYEGDNFALDAGETFSATDGSVGFTGMVFHSDGLSYDTGISEYKGSGNIVIILIAEANLSEKTYTTGDASVGMNVSVESEDVIIESTSVIIEVKSVGKKYNVDFEITLTGGKVVKGNYTGKLTAIDIPLKKKKQFVNYSNLSKF